MSLSDLILARPSKGIDYATQEPKKKEDVHGQGRACKSVDGD